MLLSDPSNTFMVVLAFNHQDTDGTIVPKKYIYTDGNINYCIESKDKYNKIISAEQLDDTTNSRKILSTIEDMRLVSNNPLFQIIKINIYRVEYCQDIYQNYLTGNMELLNSSYLEHSCNLHSDFLNLIQESNSGKLNKVDEIYTTAIKDELNNQLNK